MPSTELYDILLPQNPGFNWFWLFETMAVVGGSLLLFGLLAWWFKNGWRPLRWWVESRFIVLRHRHLSMPELLLACQAWRASTQVFWQTQTAYAQSEYQQFAARLDEACYATQEVPRETLLDLLAVAAQQLWDLARQERRRYWRNKWRGLRANWKAYHD